MDTAGVKTEPKKTEMNLGKRRECRSLGSGELEGKEPRVGMQWCIGGIGVGGGGAAARRERG